MKLTNQEANVWVQCVLSSLQGTAGEMTADAAQASGGLAYQAVAATAMVMADAVIDGLRRRLQAAPQGSIVVAKPRVPEDLRGKR